MKKKTLTKYGLHYNFWFYQTLTNQFLLQFTSNEENTLAIKPFTEFYVRDRKSYWRFCVNFSWKCECEPCVYWCFWCILFIIFERTCSVCVLSNHIIVASMFMCTYTEWDLLLHNRTNTVKWRHWHEHTLYATNV